MRIYFSPCGIGLGHVGRCIPIAKKLLENNAYLTFSTYLEGISYVEKVKFPLIKAPPIDFGVKQNGEIDFKQTIANPFRSSFTVMKQTGVELKAIRSFKPDVVVSDSRVSSLIAAKILGIPRICILNQFQIIIPRRTRLLRLAKFADYISLTIIGKIWTNGNLVLIPDFPKPYTISTGNLNIPKSYRKRVKLIGPILSKHPTELPSKNELRKKLNLPMNKKILFAPISGPLKEKHFIIEILKKLFSDLPKDYDIIFSLGYPDKSSIPQHYNNLTIYSWIPNRFEHLKACDLVISRAGHGTITQCMCYGKPMIIIPPPSHTEQQNNAKQAEKLGLAKRIEQSKLNKSSLLRNIKQMLTEETYKKIKLVQYDALKYNGLKNAVTSIIDLAKKD